MSHPTCSPSESENSDSENTYCIFLHVFEGSKFYGKDNGEDSADRQKDKVLLRASLNSVKFEIEGHATETTTIFNSNVIWECNVVDLKRMKSDNRPVKLECFMKAGVHENAPLTLIGTLLMPIRGIQTVNNMRNFQLKLHWHKLGTLRLEWREHRPELHLLLIIVKKTFIENGQFENLFDKVFRNINGTEELPADEILSPRTSDTSLMLQSQHNIYVQLLDDLGLIQVGNNPKEDYSVFNVTLTFKHIRNFTRLVENERNLAKSKNIPISSCIFHYDFLGSTSRTELFANPNDCQIINEKMALSFRASFKCLRQYFERIFYVPVNLILNGALIANSRLDFSKLMPENDEYFDLNKCFSKTGTFTFDRLHKVLSPNVQRPTVEFLFCLQLTARYSELPSPRAKCEMYLANQNFSQYEPDEQGQGDGIFNTPDYDLALQLHEPLEPLAFERPNESSCTSLLTKETISKDIISKDKHTKFAITKEIVTTEAVTKAIVTQNTVTTHALTEEAVITNNVRLNLRTCDYLRHTDAQTARSLVPTCDVATDTTDLVDELEQPPNLIIEPPKRDIGTGTERKLTQCMSVNTDTPPAPTPPPSPPPIPTPPPPPTVENGDFDDITTKVIEELQEWKEYQLQHFLTELDRKEQEYMETMKNQWEEQRLVLQAKLETKITKCQELNIKLERTYQALRTNGAAPYSNGMIEQALLGGQTVIEKMKKDVELSFGTRYQLLKKAMHTLKKDTAEKMKYYNKRQHDQEVENTKLSVHKSTLEKRVQELEQQVQDMEQTHVPMDRLKELMDDMAKQKERYAEMKKSKIFYKDQWTAITREMHTLKLRTLTVQNNQKQPNGVKLLNDNRSSSATMGVRLNMQPPEEQEVSAHSDCSTLMKDLKLPIDSESSSGEYEYEEDE